MRKKILQYSSMTVLIVSLIMILLSSYSKVHFVFYGLTGSILGIIGSIISLFIPSVYERDLRESDWVYETAENDFRVYISAREHGMGRQPVTRVYMQEHGGLTEVDVAVFDDVKGNVRIASNIKFEGKIRVK